MPNVIGRKSYFAALLVVGLFFTATQATAKTDLVLAIGGEPDNGYDPLLGWGQYGHPLFQSTLLTRGPDFSSVPDLATNLTLSEDRLIWTAILREGVKFSDGTPLTAKDVAFTFQEATRIGGVRDLTALESVEAVNDRTVVFRLKKPWITFTENFYTLGIVPAETYGPDYSRVPLGSGPYRLVSWKQGEQLIVEANPYYYGEQSPFRRLTFLFANEDASLAAAKTGQVDIVSVPAMRVDAAPANYDVLPVKSVDNRGITFPMLPNEGKRDDAGNPIGNNVTSDPAIRRAINLGIDRQKIVDLVLQGHGTPAYGPADGLPWSNPEAAITYDPEAARFMLDQAGWVSGDDGIRSKDGVRASFKINYPASDSTRQGVSVVLADTLKTLGIEGIPVGTTWENIERVVHSEPVVFGWGSHSPLEVYNIYHSTRAGVELYNPGYFSSSTVDEYFNKAQAAGSLEESYPFWKQAEWDGRTGFGPKGEAGWAWLVNLDHVYFIQKCLDTGPTQIEPHGHGWPITAGIQNWKWRCE
ncbi:MAG: ABC transporter substrate-binding protein [Phyllobacterium sp.]